MLGIYENANLELKNMIFEIKNNLNEQVTQQIRLNR